MIIEKKAAVAPCEKACPVGIDVPRYIRAIGKGNYDEALAVNLEKLPFPSICARICRAPCETGCRRNIFGNPIAIRALKRAAVDKGKMSEPAGRACDSGKRVAIIGSGPAGLTAAFYLARAGHQAIVFEAGSEAGGKMRTAIPPTRLPGNILDKEILRVVNLGVEIRTGIRITSVDELVKQGWDAIFQATGAQGNKIPQRIDIDPDTMATGCKGLYAGGELVTGMSSVIHAIAGGKRAAIAIDKFLGGSGGLDIQLLPGQEIVELRIPDLSAGKSTVAEDGGKNEEKRCLRCDIPIEIDQQLCIGCGVCETVCPGDVIRLSHETKKATLAYPGHCWTCYNCEIDCPVDAIKVNPIKIQKPLICPRRNTGVKNYGRD